MTTVFAIPISLANTILVPQRKANSCQTSWGITKGTAVGKHRGSSGETEGKAHHAVSSSHCALS